MITRSIPVLALLTHLDRADRCDRCSAEAQIRARLPDGGELQFCGHHARVHAPRLREIGAVLNSTL